MEASFDPLGEILKKIERGELSAEEGLRQLNDLDRAAREAEEQRDQLQGIELEKEITRWKRWWFIPFSVGISLTLLAAGVMYWGVVSAGLGWLFWLSWIPLLIGQAIMIIAWRSQTSRWVHVRIRQKPGEHPQLIAISLPIPLRFGAWFFRHFSAFIPQIQDKGIDELFEILDGTLSSDSPIYVHVNEDEEDVQVYVG